MNFLQTRFTCFIGCLFLNSTSYAQIFTFECFHPKERFPIVYYYNPAKDVYQDLFVEGVPLRKITDTSSLLTLRPRVLSFMQLKSAILIISPDDSSKGYIDAQNVLLNIVDRNGPNYIISKFDSGFTKIKIKYKIGSPYSEFNTTLLQLKHYVDSFKIVLNVGGQKSVTPLVFKALKEFFMMRLAHYSVLPIYLNNDYNKEDLIKKIEKDIVISEPDLWLQTMPGRLFLKSYYGKLIVPASAFNYKKSISNKDFSDNAIKKFVSYYYFDECLTNQASAHSRETLLKELLKLKATLKFTPVEQETLNALYKRIMQFDISVSEDFASQELENLSGKKLSLSEKKAVIGEGNIIIDYWASWCVPCRAKMNEHKTNVVKIGKKTYRIIYVSIDEERLSWLKAQYSFLNDTNCFRLLDGGHNEFVKKYKINAIPRYFLIEKSKLKSDHFNF